MVLLDMEIPKNCADCDKMGLRYFLECNLIFSGCANCGRHPNCPIKAEIPKNVTNGDVIKAMFPNAEYKDRHNITIEKRNSENGELQLTGMADKDWWNAPWKVNDESRTD